MKTKPAPKKKPAAAPKPIAEGKRQSIDTKLIDPHPHNRKIEPASVKGLAASMKAYGQVQPAVVRPHPDPKKKGRYQLGAGGRRFLAAKINGQPLDCIVRDLSDREIEAMLAVENLQREAPEPREEAAQIRRLFQLPDSTPQSVAAILGKDDAWVKRRMRLLDLIDPVHDLWQDPDSDIHHLPVSTMELVAQLTPEQQMGIKEELFEDQYDTPTPQDVVGWISSMGCSLKDVKWLEEPATFIKDCGPGCASSSAANDLFSQTEFADKKNLACAHCLNPSCFNKRKDLARSHAWHIVISRAPKGFIALSDRYGDKLKVELPDESTLTPRRKWDYNDWKACKKTDSNAKPFIIEENDTVKLTWKAPPKNATPQQLAASGTSEGSAIKTPEESRQASIDRVTGKRLTLVLDALKQHVDNAPPPVIKPLIDDADGTAAFDAQIHALLRLAAVFGTRYHCTQVNHLVYEPDEPDEENDTVDSPAGNKTWSDYANVTVQSAIKRLWRQIRGVFKDRLRDRSYTERKTDLIKPEFQLEMLQIAKLTGFDYTAAMARAITAVKVPGSLQNLDPVTWKPKTTTKG